MLGNVPIKRDLKINCYFQKKTAYQVFVGIFELAGGPDVCIFRFFRFFYFFRFFFVFGLSGIGSADGSGRLNDISGTANSENLKKLVQLGSKQNLFKWLIAVCSSSSETNEISVPKRNTSFSVSAMIKIAFKNHGSLTYTVNYNFVVKLLINY
jgi:hypothetical protein